MKAIDSKDACGAGYLRGGPLIVKLKSGVEVEGAPARTSHQLAHKPHTSHLRLTPSQDLTFIY